MGSLSEKARVGVAAVCAALLACPSVWAQGADQKDTGAAAKAEDDDAVGGDVILTRGGVVYRGKLTDDVDDDFVFIMTATGKRKVALGDVEYAGPADKAPKLPPETAVPTPSGDSDAPAAETDEDVAKLEAEALKGKFIVKAHAPNRTTIFHLRPASDDAGGASDDEGTYRILCDTPPCQAPVDPGTYEFALSEATDDEPIKAPGTIQVDSDTSVSGEYHSYSGLRTAGWITIFGGMGVAGIMMANSSNNCTDIDPDCEPIDPIWLGSGLGVLAVTFVTGLLMTGKDDEAEVNVAAGAARLPTARSSGPNTAQLAPAIRVSGRF